ncbi:helix-turn-helix domain-containing protein [Mucilaginibacter sp. KACC 22773]|uniref:helix-turn-helix domain-containing protein n=1 Tax=Mucilaginibacter sp. KACC 22773 TaxID=3025671 RepID=UPI002366A197|nr:helix-turn-helix domain-containing protein [Mucilaginibacter sp. KACC 22773]WDF79542.1 helix-turn-helix domain-containing protein [Mucilaginibacter sp. KACC 22773]
MHPLQQWEQDFLTELIARLRPVIRDELASVIENIGGATLDEPLNIQKAAEYLNLPVSTMYTLVNQSKIPVCKPGKRLYFLKSDLIAWVRSGRKITGGAKLH